MNDLTKVSEIASIVMKARDPQSMLLEIMYEVSRRTIESERAGHGRNNARPPRIEQVLRAVCRRCNVTRTDLMRRRRSRVPRFVEARATACIVMRHALRMSQEDVAGVMGYENHTTVHYHEQKHAAGAYPEAQFIIDQLTAEWSQPAAAE